MRRTRAGRHERFGHGVGALAIKALVGKVGEIDGAICYDIRGSTIFVYARAGIKTRRRDIDFVTVAAEANAPLTVTEPRRACRIRTATLCMILSELVGEGRVRRTPAGYLPAGW